jgi:putative ABC transport system substrate-binding protein
MRRREFLMLLGSTGIACPGAILAQTASPTPLVGMLLASGPHEAEMGDRLAAFRTELGALGWIEGDNLRIERRWFGGDARRAQDLAGEIVGLSPDLIVVQSTLGIEAARKATSMIPTVFVMVGDPVGAGFVPSFQHPGGNVTGFSAFDPEIAGKWMQSLKEIAPQTRQVTVLSYPDYDFLWPGAEHAAAALNIEVMQATCHRAADIADALAALEKRPGSAFLVWPAPLFATNREMIVRLAALYKLPAVYPFRYYASAGGLMAYGLDVIDIFRRTSHYVDRILKGEKVGDLPVQAPTKFELTINVKTAKALGLAVPAMLLASADEVIE